MLLLSIPSNTVGVILMSQQEAYQKRRLVPDPCSWSLQAMGLWGWRSIGRGRKSPANIGAVACSKADGFGVQEEIQHPGGQELRGNVISEEASEGER